MSESRPVRSTLATIVAIWLIIVFCWSTFALLGATLLRSLRPDVPAMSTPQLALAVISALLALAGGITLWQLKPVSWQILLGRVFVDLIALVVVVTHPVALPASVANSADAAAVTSIARTGGAVFGGLLLLVNLGIALYARAATTTPAVTTDSVSTAA